MSKTNISNNALKVLNKLQSHGYHAYLVGGSVRDLLMHRTPKDFDVVTNAHPNQIKKLFKNSRIIGRRFRLVHVFFHREIIEVATFRKEHQAHQEHKTNDQGMIVRDNVYGNITEDAWRRDLSINALYYNIKDASIVDYTGGFADLNNKVIRIIGEPIQRYQEDPVRILRAIRFAAKFNFKLEENTQKAILETKHLLENISSSRLFDEVTKLYHSGNAHAVHQQLIEFGLFAYLFPQSHALIDNEQQVTLIEHTLKNTDSRIQSKKPVTPAFFYAVFLWHPLLAQATVFQNDHGLPPLIAFEKAMNTVLSKQCQVVSIPKRFSQIMREMWLLQLRFRKRFGSRAYKLLEHPRFRAAYDFMLLRALSSEETIELADWWTHFQEASPAVQKQMIKKVAKENSK